MGLLTSLNTFLCNKKLGSLRNKDKLNLSSQNSIRSNLLIGYKESIKVAQRQNRTYLFPIDEKNRMMVVAIVFKLMQCT